MPVEISIIGAPTGGSNNLGWRLWVACVVMIILSGLFVGARVAIRIRIQQMGADDYTIILSLACAVIMVTFWTLSVACGYGMPVNLLADEQFQCFLKRWFIGQPFYLAVITLNKISVILLGKRIFVQKYFQIWSWTILVTVLITFIVFFFLALFQCSPMSTMWGVAPLTATCIDMNKMLIGWASMNIATDVFILLAPLPMVWQLSLKKREKALLSVVFLLGAVTTICSVLSAHNLVRGVEGISDDKYSFAGNNLFQVLEAHIGIIGACLPILQHPIRQAFPRLFQTRDTSQETSSPYYNGFKDYYGMSELSNRSRRNPTDTNWHNISVSGPRRGSDEVGIVDPAAVSRGDVTPEYHPERSGSTIKKSTTVSVNRI